jgi:hypothetical protein
MGKMQVGSLARKRLKGGGSCVSKMELFDIANNGVFPQF